MEKQLHHSEPVFPVSIKGVIFHNDKVVLLQNDRDEWELPGGRLEVGESPEATVTREIREELGLDVSVGPLLDCWVYEVDKQKHVVIVTFGCIAKSFTKLKISSEHKKAGLFSLSEVAKLRMPEGYRNSINTWSQFFNERAH